MNVKTLLMFILIASFACPSLALQVNTDVDTSVPQAVCGKLCTSDKVPIAYEHRRSGHDTVIIVCPGFFNSKSNRWMRKAVDIVSTDYDTIVFDFRGHGTSGGKFSWSAREDLDLNAVLDYADKEDYKKIGILGFSLGAAAAINAADTRSDITSMVLISCPTNFSRVNFNFWEPEMFSDLIDNISCRWEGKGARTDNIFMPGQPPIESVGNIKNTPILFIHGDKDWVIKSSHSKKLYDAANTPKRLEIIKDGGHAERLIQKYPDKMRELILGWFSETLK